MNSKYAQNYREIEWLPIPKHEPQPVRKARSRLAGPMIISDTIDPTQSMADGRHYTSKSRLRATYRPDGNPDGKRYGEVGNDVPMAPPPPPHTRVKRPEIKATVARALSKAGLGA